MTTKVRLKPDATYHLDIAVSQTAKSSRATGSFRLTDEASGDVFEATDLGVLQAADGWASVTARLRQRTSGADHGVLVIVEDADPFADGRRTVYVSIDGQARASGVLQ